MTALTPAARAAREAWCHGHGFEPGPQIPDHASWEDVAVAVLAAGGRPELSAAMRETRELRGRVSRLADTLDGKAADFDERAFKARSSVSPLLAKAEAYHACAEAVRGLLKDGA